MGTQINIYLNSENLVALIGYSFNIAVDCYLTVVVGKLWLLPGELLVEISSVKGVFDNWNEGTLHLSVLNQLNFNSRKPLMLQDFLAISLEPKPLAWLFLQEIQNKRFGLTR